MTYLKIKCDEWLEERRFKSAFPDKTFHEIDKTLKRAYFFENPYRISRKFLQKNGAENIYQYGETPLRLMYELAKMGEVTPEDHLFELGSGRGRTCFFLRHFFKCQVTGIEEIPLFVKRAEKLNHRFHTQINFIQGDFLKADLAKASIIYLYGSTLEDEAIKELCCHIPKGTRVLTASYPLSDYDSSFTLLKKQLVYYPWGETEVFLNICH